MDKAVFYRDKLKTAGLKTGGYPNPRRFCPHSLYSKAGTAGTPHRIHAGSGRRGDRPAFMHHLGPPESRPLSRIQKNDVEAFYRYDGPVLEFRWG